MWEIEGDRSYHISKLARALKHIFSPCEKCAFVFLIYFKVRSANTKLVQKSQH